MPGLSVVVSQDGLGAKLGFGGFAAGGWKSIAGDVPTPDAAGLRAFLESRGIAPKCIRDDMLAWVAATLDASTASSLEADWEAVQGIDVAEGEPPRHEEPRGLAFHASYVEGGDAIGELRRLLDLRGFEGVRGDMDPAHWVVSGSTVLSFQGIIEGAQGSDVFGSPVPPLSVRARLPPFGKSLFLRDRVLIAACDGVLVIENGVLKVLGADSLPACHVAVSEDRMSADLVLGSNYLSDWHLTLEMARSAIRELGVICTASDRELQAAIGTFNRDSLPATLSIARGRPAVPGRAGRLELLVDPEPDVPLPGADGTIDFKAFSFFRSVEKGDILAKVIPPVPGEAGRDVHGAEIPPAPVPAFAFEPGPNTALTDGEPARIEALVAGRLAVKAGVPEVVEVLDVSGDVSLKSGNIRFPGSVQVSGDVHNRMEVLATGDVEVRGAVEDSVIRSDGAIVIRGGVNGFGKGLIKSRLSSVTLGYLHNQRIESHSDIVVFNEIINSSLLARRKIHMRYGKYSVLGGHLLAGLEMDLFNVGSEAEGKTVLEVGKDFEVEEEIAGKTAALMEHTRDLEFLLDMESQLAGILRRKKAGADEEAMLEKRARGAAEILEQWIGELREELEELSKRLYTRDPCEILIRGTAFPGTVIKYRQQVLVVSEPVSNRRWVFRDKGGPPAAEGMPA